MSDHAARYDWKPDYPIFIRRGLMVAIPVFLLWLEYLRFLFVFAVLFFSL